MVRNTLKTERRPHLTQHYTAPHACAAHAEATPHAALHCTPCMRSHTSVVCRQARKSSLGSHHSRVLVILGFSGTREVYGVWCGLWRKYRRRLTPPRPATCAPPHHPPSSNKHPASHIKWRPPPLHELPRHMPTPPHPAPATIHPGPFTRHCRGKGYQRTQAGPLLPCACAKEMLGALSWVFRAFY